MHRSKIAIFALAFLLTACSEDIERIISVLEPIPDGGVQVDIPPTAQPLGGDLTAPHEEGGSNVYGVSGKITYTLDLLDLSPDLAAYIADSVAQAVTFYNDNGQFEKHLTINYDASIATAQGGSDGTISFGGKRNLRTAMHVISHTLGIGTYNEFWDLVSDGSWQGPRGNAVLSSFDSADSIIAVEDGTGHLLTPYALNDDLVDFSDASKIRHVKLIEAIRCDMGAGPCYDFEGSNLKIVNRASDLVLDIADNVNGGNVRVSTDLIRAGQLWTVASGGLGEISIRNSMPGERAVDTWNSGQVNGTNLALYGFWGGDAQLYTVEEVEPGYFSISPKIAPTQCMDAYGTTNGSNVGTWACSGAQNQQWSFVSTD